MPSSRLQFQLRIQNNLADSLGAWFDSDAVQDSIQDGYDEILCDTQCYEASTTINFTANSVYYDLYNLVIAPNFMRPVRLFNHATNRWIPVCDTRYLDKLRHNWETTFGNPVWAVINNHQYLSFFPHHISGSFDLFYKVCPDKLSSDGQLLQVPDSHLKVLENYCTADLLESMGEPKKAQDYWSDYKKGIQDLKEQTSSRMSPDLYMQLGGRI